jgi:hypothetical protein
MPSWFWDTMWKWFGEKEPPPPPPPPRDKRADAGADIKTKHEKINWKHCDDD